MFTISLSTHLSTQSIAETASLTNDCYAYTELTDASVNLIPDVAPSPTKISEMSTSATTYIYTLSVNPALANETFIDPALALVENAFCTFTDSISTLSYVDYEEL